MIMMIMIMMIMMIMMMMILIPLSHAIIKAEQPSVRSGVREVVILASMLG